MTRTPSAVDRIADDFLAHYVVLDPVAATEMGLKGHDHEMTDLSPAGHAARAALGREALQALAAATPADDTDRVTIDAMTDTLRTQLALDDAGETLAPLNNLASPLQGLRDVFDLMATDTDEDWATIAARLRALPAAAAGSGSRHRCLALEPSPLRRGVSDARHRRSCHRRVTGRR